MKPWTCYLQQKKQKSSPHLTTNGDASKLACSGFATGRSKVSSQTGSKFFTFTVEPGISHDGKTQIHRGELSLVKQSETEWVMSDSCKDVQSIESFHKLTRFSRLSGCTNYAALCVFDLVFNKSSFGWAECSTATLHALEAFILAEGKNLRCRKMSGSRLKLWECPTCNILRPHFHKGIRGSSWRPQGAITPQPNPGIMPLASIVRLPFWEHHRNM